MRFRRRPRTPTSGAYDLPPAPPDGAVVDEPYTERVVQEEIPPAPPPPGRPGRDIWPWLLLLLVLVLGGLAALYFLTRDENEPARTNAPVVARKFVQSVVGLPQRTARTQLASRGFRSVVRPVPSSRPRGIVTGQRPRAGLRAPAGSAVLLVVSSGPAKVAVPDVLGLRAADAVKRVRAVGLQPSARGVFAAKPPGVVADQNPNGGAQATKGSRVLIEISKGRRRVVVPPVVDSDRTSAERTLRKAGFVPAVFVVPAEDPEGTVVAQSPRAGLRAVKGSKVRINVSDGSRGGDTGGGTGGGSTTGTTRTQPPAKVSVPDVVGLAQTSAQRRLQNAGLFANVFYVASAEPQGTVVAQNPSGGESVRSGSSVRINVSNGPNPKPARTVPDVVGDDQQTAETELRQAGFRVQVFDEPTDDPSQDGFVIDEQPAGGTKAPQGSLVTISVGRIQ
jgi:beta-lactam-binding protein with PASTA domain